MCVHFCTHFSTSFSVTLAPAPEFTPVALTDLCCINNSLAPSPANLNLLVFSFYNFLLCHLPPSLTAVILLLLSPLWDSLSEGWVLKYFVDERRGKEVLFFILVVSFHPQNTSHIFFFSVISLLLRYLGKKIVMREE